VQLRVKENGNERRRSEKSKELANREPGNEKNTKKMIEDSVENERKKQSTPEIK